VEVALQPGEPAAEEFDDSAPIEDEEVEEDENPDWEPPIAPPMSRRPLPASRWAIVLGTLIVAFAAVAIPVIRSILSEPRQIAGADWQGGFRESIPAAFGETMREDPREPMQGDFGESSEAVEPRGPVAREEVAEIEAMIGPEEPPILDPPAVEPPPAETLGSFAVQINASPWANVEVDGIDLGATPLANIPLFAGEHSFRVKMPDGRMIDRTIEIDAERRFISFE
jgi:hypothetical protein